MRWWLVWFCAVLAPPILAGLVSIICFVASRKAQPMRKRLLASAHGIVTVLLYALAWIFLVVGISRPSLALPFFSALLVPAVLILSAFYTKAHGPYIGCKCPMWRVSCGSVGLEAC
jgi:hypothetical protein